MAKYGYLIYTVRVHERYRPDVAFQFGTLDGGGNLRNHLATKLDALRAARLPHADERTEQAFTVLDLRLPGPHLWLKAEAGAFGNRGATTNVDTGNRRTFGHRDATMSEKRAMFVLPHQSEVGFLFCERISNSHLKGHLENPVMRDVGRDTNSTVRADRFVDYPAWAAFLEEATGFQAKSVWRPRILEDRVRGGDVRDEGELTMAVTGGTARSVALALAPILRSRFEREPNAIEIRTPEVLLPANPDAFERRRIELTLEGPSGQRTIVIERETLPAFVYPLDDQPGDESLYGTWVEEAKRLAGEYGVDVGADWDDAL